MVEFDGIAASLILWGSRAVVFEDFRKRELKNKREVDFVVVSFYALTGSML